MDEDTATRAEMETRRTAERLAALIKTAPAINLNYTNAVETAKWIIAEAGRLGWSLTIEEGK